MSVVQEKKSNPTATAYGNVPGYDPSQPANSAQNRTAIGRYQSQRPGASTYGIPSTPVTRPPSQPPVRVSDRATAQPTYKSAIIPKESTPDSRTQSDMEANKNIESAREVAPGYISTGSPQDIQVREREIAQAEQNYKDGGFIQEQNTVDQFAKQRESALKTDAFNYSKYPGSGQNKYFTPKDFLTPTGERSDTNVQAKSGTPDTQQKQLSQQRTLDDQLQNIQLKLSRGVGLTSQEELIYHTALQEQRDTAFFNSNVPSQVKGQTTFTITAAPVSKPTQATTPKQITVSNTVLEKSDLLRKQEDEQPLEKTLPLEVITYKETPTVNVSESVLAKSDLLRKEEGQPPLEKVTSLEVFSYRPVKETPVNVSSTVLKQSDVLRKKEGEKPLEQTVPLEVITYKEDVRAELAQAQGLLQKQQGSEVSRFMAFPSIPDIVAKPLGIAQKEKVQSETIPSTTILEAATFIPIGGTGLGLVGRFGKAFETVVTKLKGSPVVKIISGVKSVEEFEPISETRVTTSKPVGKITTFEQVGIAKTEVNVNPEIAKLEPVVTRESTGKVKAEVPQPPSSALQEPKIGIGSKGEPVKVEQPAKATLTQPEAIGEPKIPVTIILDDGGAVAYFTPPSSKIVASDVLATEITEKQAAELGFTKAEGLIRTYRGQLTEGVLAKMEKMGLADVALQFTERISEAVKVAQPLAFEIGQGENLGKLSGLRPAVTRIVTGGGQYELKRTEQETKKLPEDIFKEDTAKATGKLEPKAQFFKPTMEEVQSRYPLMSVKEELIPDILSKMTGTTTEAVKETPFTTSPLGLFQEPASKPTTGKLTKEETTTISLTTPPGFERPTLESKTSLESISTTKETISLISKSELGTEQINKQVSGLIGTTKKETLTKLTTETDLISKNETDLINLTGQSSITAQTTRQSTLEIQKLITSNPFETTPPPTKTTETFTTPSLPTLPDKYNKLFEKRKKGKSKKTEEFTGNAPLTSVVGLTKGQEVVYGKAAAKRAAQSFRSTKKNELVLGNNKKSSILKPEGNKLEKEPRRKFRL